EFKSSPTLPLPLDLTPAPESCDQLNVEWMHDASGFLIAAATGNIVGDAESEVVVAGSSGVRALRISATTEQATIWSAPFQARFQQVTFAQLDEDNALEIVAATAASGISRSGVLALQGDTGAVKWSRQIVGGSRAVRVGDFNQDS